MTVDIKKWYRLSYLCAHCRACTVANYHKLGKVAPICPSGDWGGFESYYSLGWTEIARNLIEGKIKSPTKALLDIVYTCTSCAACSANCKENTCYGIESEKTIWLLEDLRAHLVDLGWGPLPKHVNFCESTEKNHNPYHEPHDERFAWLKEKIPQKAKTVYFAGCTASYRQKSIAESTVKILKSLGIDFGILGQDEWCCGSPLIRTGQRKSAREVAKNNVDTIKKSGANRVVTSCAGCYMTLKEDYERLFGLKLNFEVLHTTELLSSLLKEGKLEFTKEVNMAITYHDPCHSGRSRAVLLPDLEKASVYEPPREILKAIPEIKLVEMPRNRDDAWCCGAGGGVKAAYPELAIWAATERLKEVEEVGVQNVVSSCPFCKRNLQDGAEASNKPIKVFDVTELVAQAL